MFFKKKKKKSDLVKNMNPWAQCHDIDTQDEKGLPKKKSGCIIKKFFNNIVDKIKG